MGEFADDAIREGIDGWHGSGAPRGALGWGELPIDRKKRVRCNGCGYGALYWHKHEGKWRLHHWTLFGKMTQPAFVLHRCGFLSDGTPKQTNPGAQTSGDASGRDHSVRRSGRGFAAPSGGEEAPEPIGKLARSDQPAPAKSPGTPKPPYRKISR